MITPGQQLAAMRKIKTRICSHCGITFETVRNNKDLCNDCKRKAVNHAAYIKNKGKMC
jgi:NMD protein affecting ribosome stability and mRNA decay